MIRGRALTVLHGALAVGTVLLALSAVAAAFWAIGWLLGAAGKAVGVR